MDKKYFEKFNKEDVYEVYESIIENTKKYDSITRAKMIDIIMASYEDYHKIISMCTLRELDFLKKLVDKKEIELNKNDNTYDYEVDNLYRKMLIKLDGNKVILLADLEKTLEELFKHLDRTKKQKEDEIIITIIGCIRLLGIERVDNTIKIFAMLNDLDSKDLTKLLQHSILFRFNTYVIYDETYSYLLVYRSYLEYADELIDLYREKQFGIKVIDDELYKNVYYYGYDMRNKVVKDFMGRNDLFFMREAIYMTVLFDGNRNGLKKVFKNLGMDASNLDEVMDNMPSSKYGLLSKKEYAEKIMKDNKFQEEQNYEYHKQTNASMHPKDCDLFYKLYFALLEYTNQEYKINPNLKIYKNKYLNPQELYPIVNKFFEEKETIVDKVVKENPYILSKTELEYLKDFKRGIRDNFIIYKYEDEYTLISSNSKMYMVKGLRSPIDEIIDYRDLPYAVETSLIPFKGYIVYDGMLGGFNINIGTEMKKNLLNEAASFPRIYKL